MEIGFDNIKQMITKEESEALEALGPAMDTHFVIAIGGNFLFEDDHVSDLADPMKIRIVCSDVVGEVDRDSSLALLGLIGYSLKEYADKELPAYDE